MNRAVIYLVVAGAFAAFCFSAGHHVEHLARVAEVTKMKEQQAEALAAANKAAADAQQAARNTEEKRVADMSALDAQYTKEMNDAKANADRVIADLRSGAVQLRQRFTCKPGSTSATGKAGASASLGVGQPACGLSAEDAGFLVSEAKRADSVVVQLQACQAIVKTDRYAP